MIYRAKTQNGNYHAIIYNVPKGNLSEIESNKNVKEYYLFEELGYSYLEGSENVYKPYLSLISANDRIFKEYGCKLERR